MATFSAHLFLRLILWFPVVRAPSYVNLISLYDIGTYLLFLARDNLILQNLLLTVKQGDDLLLGCGVAYFSFGVRVLLIVDLGR